MKLWLAVPTYGPVESEAARRLRLAVMHAAYNGVQWLGDISPERMKFDAARNHIVNLALHEADPGDGIFWLDSDVILEPNAITRLVQQEKDFITGIYVQRGGAHFPLVANYDRFEDTFNWLLEWPKDVVAPIDGCGFGCVLTSIKMLQAMQEPWFTFEKFSEDFDFCLRAKKAGYQLYVDTGVLCGHLKEPIAATVQDFYRVRDSGDLRKYMKPDLVSK